MTTTLPRPEVKTTETSGVGGTEITVDVVISREGRGRSYQGKGADAATVVKQVVEAVIADSYTREWLP